MASLWLHKNQITPNRDVISLFLKFCIEINNSPTKLLRCFFKTSFPDKIWQQNLFAWHLGSWRATPGFHFEMTWEVPILFSAFNESHVAVNQSSAGSGTKIFWISLIKLRKPFYLPPSPIVQSIKAHKKLAWNEDSRPLKIICLEPPDIATLMVPALDVD